MGSIYVRLYESEISIASIEALGKILKKVPDSVELCVEKLFDFFDQGNEWIKEESIVVVAGSFLMIS